ncbi:C-GCAxxG-C-C family protein [Chloroflexota bacterium]
MLALQDVFDMRDDNVFKAASGLAAGVGQMYDTCGALLGASMMLSLKYGRSREEINDHEKLNDSFLPVAKLYKWFEKEFSSATCRKIRTKMAGVFYALDIPWQAELAKEAGLPERCAELTAKTAAKTAEMLWDTIEKEKNK